MARKRQHTLDIVSNGLGGQSMILLHLACKRVIPARVSVTGDTGSEEDRLCSDGRRVSAGQFFAEVVEPYARSHGVTAVFVRAQDGEGQGRPPLHEVMAAMRGNAASGFGFQPAPLWGSGGGRLDQKCTDIWKLAAIRQEARRRGATRLRSAIGIHAGEATRRCRVRRPLGSFRGSPLGREWRLYQTSRDRREDEPILWCSHYYPLVELGMDRAACRAELERVGLPYLVTTECDHCPHKDPRRWLQTSPATIDRLADLEERYEGEFFLTRDRIPLKLAVEHYRRLDSQGLLPADSDFACPTNFCGH